MLMGKAWPLVKSTCQGAVSIFKITLLILIYWGRTNMEGVAVGGPLKRGQPSGSALRMMALGEH